MTAASTSFYQPLVVSQRSFAEPKRYGSREIQDPYNDGVRVASYRFNNFGGRVDFGMNLGSLSQVRIGYRRVRYPRLTRYALASDQGRGGGARIHAQRQPDGWQPTGDRAELGLGVAVPFRSDVLWINAAGGSDFGRQLPPDRLFVLDGRTPVGPVTLVYALTTTNPSSVWLSLGRPLGTGTILERGIFR